MTRLTPEKQRLLDPVPHCYACTLRFCSSIPGGGERILKKLRYYSVIAGNIEDLEIKLMIKQTNALFQLHVLFLLFPPYFCAFFILD